MLKVTENLEKEETTGVYFLRVRIPCYHPLSAGIQESFWLHVALWPSSCKTGTACESHHVTGP